MNELPNAIQEGEELGRGIFDSKKARQARAGKVPPRVFRERTGMRELSVDRLSFGAHAQIAVSHDSERPGQEFHGWAKVSAHDAATRNRTVIPQPIVPTNPYHAEIVLPDFADLDADEEQDQHALNLAMLAIWFPRAQV